MCEVAGSRAEFESARPGEGSEVTATAVASGQWPGAGRTLGMVINREHILVEGKFCGIRCANVRQRCRLELRTGDVDGRVGRQQHPETLIIDKEEGLATDN